MKARNEATIILERIQNVESFAVSGRKDAVLLKHFILEQFPFFKRFCLSRSFFVFHDTLPDTIDPWLWVVSWMIVSGSMIFFVYWVFAWGVKNGGTTLSAWGMNFAIGAIQDIFFVQVAKVYIIRFIGVEASKTAMRRPGSAKRVSPRLVKSPTRTRPESPSPPPWQPVREGSQAQTISVFGRPVSPVLRPR
jgi:hypothetical protein